MRALNEFFQELPDRPQYIILAILAALLLWASLDMVSLSLARHSFYFENVYSGKRVREIRALPVLKGREEKLGLYVAEYLLGPGSIDAEPLFARNTVVRSLMIRGSKVYIDLDEGAALPEPQIDDLRPAIALLEKGIRRNFSFVNEVSLTIAGRIPYIQDIDPDK